MDRSGSGKLIEAYPAAALRVWRLSCSGYKVRKGASARTELIRELRERTKPWLLAPQGFFEDANRDDNIFDSMIAALIGRASAVGLVYEIPGRLRRLARTEGWIHLPVPDSLDKLVATDGPEINRL
jgi:hypothetical protein